MRMKELILMTKLYNLINIIWKQQFLRFLAVGALNTIFGYSVFALLFYFGLHYALAVLFSTIIGVLFNFFTTGRIVFQNRNNCLLTLFIISYLFTYSINLGILKVLKYFNFNMYLAQASVLMPIAILTYFIQKKFVFRW